MLSALKKLIPPTMRQALVETMGRRTHARTSYAQEGEDLLLLRLFDNRDSGIYVDVGAHHPFRFSNTCLLHERGWRGINIDARPGSMQPFRRFRRGDVNLELGVSEQQARLEFFVFAEAALNTFDAELARTRQAEGWPLVQRKLVDCLPLARIIEQHLPTLGATQIDLLTVDAEGLDLQVLRSNDWGRFRPKAIVVEILQRNLGQVMRSETVSFLAGVGYCPSAKLYNSVVFLPDDAVRAAEPGGAPSEPT